MAETPSEKPFACPKCGSTHVRRSAPHGSVERGLRALTPYRFFRCRACGYRGKHFGHLPLKQGEARPPSGRRIEKRDLQTARKQRRRWLLAVVLSVGLGAAAGVYLNSCQQQAEQAQPPQ